MKSKVININGCKTTKSVNITLARDSETGKDYIEISAWHEHETDGDYYQLENIECDDRDLLIGIISSFTNEQARNFANSFTF